MSVPADWAVDLEAFDNLSLGEALKGYLQDLPTPVVPACVHGEILRVLQGESDVVRQFFKGWYWEWGRIYTAGWLEFWGQARKKLGKSVHFWSSFSTGYVSILHCPTLSPSLYE